MAFLSGYNQSLRHKETNHHSQWYCYFIGTFCFSMVIFPLHFDVSMVYFPIKNAGSIFLTTITNISKIATKGLYSNFIKNLSSTINEHTKSSHPNNSYSCMFYICKSTIGITDIIKGLQEILYLNIA